MKILIATEKPFAKSAVESMRAMIEHEEYDLRLLENYTDKSELLEAVSKADALIVRSDKITADVIAAAPNLKIIVRAGAGYDNIDLDAASERNIVVMNTPGQNANAVAELVMGLAVYAARNMFNGKSGSELKGKKLGIYGFGNIGRLVAKLAQGYGMEVSAYDAYVKKSDISDAHVTPIYSPTDLFKENQYVSLHIPATPDNLKCVDWPLLKSMPQGATLINTARKEIIDETAIKRALRERDDFKYVSDIAPDCADELKEAFPARIYATPKKMGAQTAEANFNAGVAAARQVINFIQNDDTTFQVNKKK